MPQQLLPVGSEVSFVLSPILQISHIAINQKEEIGQGVEGGLLPFLALAQFCLNALSV